VFAVAIERISNGDTEILEMNATTGAFIWGATYNGISYVQISFSEDDQYLYFGGHQGLDGFFN